MSDVIAALRTMGKESYANIYRRHGASGEVLGVSTPDMAKLQKQHRGDHALAQQLWKSGIHEARLIATQICDAAKLSKQELEVWLGDVEGHPLVDAFALLVVKTAHADALMTSWMKSKNEWIASAGWRMLALAAQDGEGHDDAFFAPYLAIIEAKIHAAPNRVRHTMNSALIAIGGRGGALEKEALRVAKAIGKVEVDHGETSCETPDAAGYIAKLKARAAKKGAKR